LQGPSAAIFFNAYCLIAVIIMHNLFWGCVVAVKKNQVFLVQGQFLKIMDGVDRLSPEIEQFVVVADDDRAAYKLVELNEPGFSPVGHATLEDYEKTAGQLRATLRGEDVGWKLLVAPGMGG
jgi:hypothetical protein